MIPWALCFKFHFFVWSFKFDWLFNTQWVKSPKKQSERVRKKTLKCAPLFWGHVQATQTLTSTQSGSTRPPSYNLLNHNNNKRCPVEFNLYTYSSVGLLCHRQEVHEWFDHHLHQMLTTCKSNYVYSVIIISDHFRTYIFFVQWTPSKSQVVQILW